jgi:Predicted AAA-ATPase
MKRLPIGIQTFCDIVLNNYLYVDKTEKIFDLVNNPKGVYFLSRPRRFGKSLLISTLNEIFEGNKELFKGLWIYKADYAWEKHPVVRIDFSKSKECNQNKTYR